MRLPEEIEVEIILRLPAKSVQRFKTVCKRWESLISSPNFITMYNHHYCRRRRYLCYTKDRFNARPLLGVIDDEESKQNASSSSSSSNVVIEFPPFYRDDSWAKEGIEYGIDDDEENIREFLEQNSDPTRRYDIHIMGPVNNGVYCIYQRLGYTSGGTLILWNPSTRSYKYIFPHISFPFPIHWHVDVCTRYNHEVWRPLRVHMGFGYNPTTTTINNNNNGCVYKFVVIYSWYYVYCAGLEEVQISLYNSSSSSAATNSCLTLYREVGIRIMPYYIYSDPPFCNSFVNGRCHFSCGKIDLTLPDNSDDDMVLEYGVFTVNVSMDEHEHNNTFKYMRGPPIPVDRNDHKIHPFDFCRFRDSGGGIRISVWVVRETIAMVAFYPESHRRKLEVWLMTQYGVEDSWNLLCSIPIEEGFDHVVGIPDDHRIFVGNSRGDLLSYALDDDCDQALDVVKTIEPLGPSRAALGLFSYEESLTPISP